MGIFGDIFKAGMGMQPKAQTGQKGSGGKSNGPKNVCLIMSVNDSGNMIKWVYFNSAGKPQEYSNNPVSTEDFINKYIIMDSLKYGCAKMKGRGCYIKTPKGNAIGITRDRKRLAVGDFGYPLASNRAGYGVRDLTTPLFKR